MGDNQDGCPVVTNKSEDCSGCPISNQSPDSKNVQHALNIGDMPTGQERQPNQSMDLSRRRAVSNIEKASNLVNALLIYMNSCSNIVPAAFIID